LKGVGDDRFQKEPAMPPTSLLNKLAQILREETIRIEPATVAGMSKFIGEPGGFMRPPGFL
jgi:hypothetical protein